MCVFFIFNFGARSYDIYIYNIYKLLKICNVTNTEINLVCLHHVHIWFVPKWQCVRMLICDEIIIILCIVLSEKCAIHTQTHAHTSSTRVEIKVKTMWYSVGKWWQNILICPHTLSILLMVIEIIARFYLNSAIIIFSNANLNNKMRE